MQLSGEDGRLDHINTENSGSVGQSPLECQVYCLWISPAIILYNNYFQYVMQLSLVKLRLDN